MANENQGWIKVYRKTMENPGYFSEPFCRMMAWIDLLLLANHSEGFFYCRGIKVTVVRGQIGWGIEQLAKRWKWSRGKVERYMKDLENEQQIVRQKSNITTLISIVNYEKYQGDGKADNKANGKADGQQTVKQTDINKNVKKEKKEKNDKESSLPDAPADNSLNKNQSEPYWQSLLSTWVSFYKKKKSEDPTITGRECRELKSLIGLLKARADKKGVGWNEENALSRFSQFLERAYSDPWLSKNFLLSNLVKQFDKIVASHVNGANGAVITPHVVKTQNGKSTGAIELIERLKAQQYPAIFENQNLM